MKIMKWHDIFFTPIKYGFYKKMSFILSKGIMLFLIIKNEFFQELIVGATQNG